MEAHAAPMMEQQLDHSGGMEEEEMVRRDIAKTSACFCCLL